MAFQDRLKQRREELGLSRQQLADLLGLSSSAVSNYENGISFPKEPVMLRLFDCLRTEPNILFQDSYSRDQRMVSEAEWTLLERYRGLSAVGRSTMESVLDTLCAYRDEMERDRPMEMASRRIPLYRSPAAAGYAAPVFGEDFDYIPVAGEVPPGAEFAVRIQGDSMAPHIADGSVVYVNRDPLKTGDVGIFCVDGDMLCKQYYCDPYRTVYLFSLNRDRADADVVLTASSGRTLVSFGRVMIRSFPLPSPDALR